MRSVVPPQFRLNNFKVEKALSGGPQLETLVDGFNITLSRKDIQTLKDMTWLNDEVRYSSDVSEVDSSSSIIGQGVNL